MGVGSWECSSRICNRTSLFRGRVLGGSAPLQRPLYNDGVHVRGPTTIRSEKDLHASSIARGQACICDVASSSRWESVDWVWRSRFSSPSAGDVERVFRKSVCLVWLRSTVKFD